MTNGFKEFNESECVAFIRNQLSPQSSAKYSDDDILFVVDFIWDYYEKQGMLSLNDIDVDDELLDGEELITWCKRRIKDTEGLNIDDADVSIIVKGELDYEESLEDYI